MKINVGIVGISGYTGLELVKMLVAHPNFELCYAGASSSGKLSDSFSSLKGVIDMPIEVANADEIKAKCDLVFLALPHKEAMSLASKLRKSGVKIVDLSADYRVSQENYEKNYCSHIDLDGLKDAVYGLVEINRDRIKNANLIANPGCYPTCSLLGLLPFANMLDPKFGVMIDAKSGLSGAGKSLKQTSHFVSVNENMNAYSPLTHRHSDEIKEHLNLAHNTNIDVMFVPHLIPLTRGMLVSSYGILKPEFNDIDLISVLENFYKNEKFIRIRREPVSIKDVAGTHFCDIFAINNGGKIWINSSIDNLLRGASSQALANANLMFGFDESLGLPLVGDSI
ncbi:N-acetyl-gamma-glutamyl-phosphate reductase [Campylobacter hyointestinalis]|uniref:N-acetyl-gamma-glutamyl-phosphate reductase n=1 Tax=Campylobacter hyointestinalis subsp. lawsonii TaxID=91353 RepID=A0AAV6EJI3_CAMHY|nr:N-acetyl-gamma-glutamyl-phosphate reductase [Campylobacter hyointestinalis]KAB0614334.1 N-acetyl-gamma-glutamyl-phosphate reductase [Campylobacter hyointestinalis subsp. lawsonii]QKF70085.1 N-acetyl-gamma-glutamylphosphate reductase, common form [Campylobacter hyointestinalis subsp. lawsonii]RAZ28947.1 N-acetyl-gamma-glutamyl-phosphate reductase [Campylobacter hyointestinalis subsp. lawsonii]